AAKLARGPADQSPDFDFLAALALAHLEKWDEAKLAFDAGFRKAPGDSRFLVELAGVAYKQKDFRAAKKHLHAALKLNPRDPYSSEFLATIYFLEDNLEAALKYWNPEDKPRLGSVAFKPSLRLKESLRDRAVAFNAPQVLTANSPSHFPFRFTLTPACGCVFIPMRATKIGIYRKLSLAPLRR